MRFARLIAAAVVAVAVAAGGFFAFAPPVAGQGKSILVGPEADLEVFSGGGSRIGASVRDVDQADVTREKLAGQTGAVVDEVRSESPAAKAGFKSGDVIVAFDGERVRSARQLGRLVAETPAGRAVKVALQRAGAKLEVDVTPESPVTAMRGPFGFESEWPRVKTFPRLEGDLKRKFPAMEFHGEGFPGGDSLRIFGIPGPGRLGVQVQGLSDQLASYFGVKEGVLVSDVDEGSPADKAGVKAGDVITAVNGQQVTEPEQLRRELAKADEGKATDLSVMREKKALTLKVETDSPKKTERRIRRTV
jgi:serine protease Do